MTVLDTYGAYFFQDVPKLYSNERFETAIGQISGQTSGRSLQLFYMLSGSDNLVHPGRMVLRFLKDITARDFTPAEAQYALTEVAQSLRRLGIDMSPRLLDHTIWNYQRGQSW
jgi:hypothetical protein